MTKTNPSTNKDMINKLDKEIALIKKDIMVIKENHLYHIEKSMKYSNDYLECWLCCIY